jgi:peptidyl-prolyl cis-trans isomerase B (cyclophilin B)
VATKKERQRKLARDAHARRLQRHADRARRTRQLSAAIIIAVLVVAVGVGGAAIAGVFSSPKPTAAASGKSPSATPTVTASPSATPTPSPGVTSAMVNGKCVYTRSGTAARKVKLPSRKPDLKATYVATIATNRGNIVIDLLNSKAPCTVNSFVSLASQKFFNKTPCHRLTTAASGIYVLQCGDPTGTGEGGPGYEFYTENLTGAKYPAGTVAMARASSMDSNGSQFFLVYKQTPLPPSYTPFGTIVSGLNILQNVAKAGSDNSNGPGDGHPKEKVEIDSVTITKT